MQFKRSKRVGELILQEISKMILHGEIKDPRIGFVTLTNIEITDDLRNAKVFASILGEETERAASVEGLNNASGYIKRELGRRIKIKHMPDLFFLIDRSTEHSIQISKILDELNSENQAEPTIKT